MVRPSVVAHALIALVIFAAATRATFRYGLRRLATLAFKSMQPHLVRCRLGPAEEKEPAIARELDLELGRLRVLFAKLFFAIMASIAMILSLMSLHTALRHAMVETLTQQVSVPLFCIVVTCPAVMPRLVSVRTLDMWHWIIQLITLVAVSPWIIGKDIHLFHQVAPFAAGLSFASCAVNLKIRVSFFANLMNAAFVLWAEHVVGEGQAGNEFKTRTMMILVGKIVGFIGIESCLIYYAMDTNDSKFKRSAMLSLLRMVCDAVVNLDDEGRMTEHDVSLSTMLFLGADRSLAGERFAQYIRCGEDVERFAAAVETSDRSGPSLLHIRLRDAWGSYIKAQLFVVPFRSGRGKRRFVVGLKEDCEDLGMPGSVPDPAEDGQVSRTPSTERATRGPRAVLSDNIAEAVLQLQEARSLSTSISRAGSATSTDSNRVVADVVPEPGLQIRYASEGLKRQFPELKRGASLQPLFGDDGAKLLEWVMATDLQVLRGERRPGAQNYGFARVGQPTLPRREILVHFPAPPTADADAEGMERSRRRRVSVKISSWERAGADARIGEGTSAVQERLSLSTAQRSGARTASL